MKECDCTEFIIAVLNKHWEHSQGCSKLVDLLGERGRSKQIFNEVELGHLRKALVGE